MPSYTTKGSFSKQVQPGWTIEDDGFGLLTSRVTFIDDSSSASGGPSKLDKHPFDERLQCHKTAYTVNSANRSVVVADYVGIATGANTYPQSTIDYSSASETITAHPAFADGKGYNGATKKLSEYGWDFDKGEFDPTNNDAISNGLVGTKKFATGEMTVTTVIYTSNKAVVEFWVNNLGRTVVPSSNPAAQDVILPKSMSPVSSKHDRFVLVSNVSYEKYAHLWKVSIVYRVATGGWHKYIYKYAE